MSHLISSFQIDHTNLKPGVYVSRVDGQGKAALTTFDIRMTYCNREPSISPAAMHTIEHIGATYLRNDPDFGKFVVYFGPMGCNTGFYLIMRGKLDVGHVIGLIKCMMEYVRQYKGKVPGTAKSQCGNYLMHDLAMAKYAAEQWLSRECRWEFKYPRCRRAKDSAGRTVYDA